MDIATKPGVTCVQTFRRVYFLHQELPIKDESICIGKSTFFQKNYLIMGLKLRDLSTLSQNNFYYSNKYAYWFIFTPIR